MSLSNRRFNCVSNLMRWEMINARRVVFEIQAKWGLILVGVPFGWIFNGIPDGVWYSKFYHSFNDQMTIGKIHPTFLHNVIRGLVWNSAERSKITKPTRALDLSTETKEVHFKICFENGPLTRNPRTTPNRSRTKLFSPRNPFLWLKCRHGWKNWAWPFMDYFYYLSNEKKSLN